MGIKSNVSQLAADTVKQRRAAADQTSGNNAGKSFAAVDPVQRKETAQLKVDDEMLGKATSQSPIQAAGELDEEQ